MLNIRPINEYDHSAFHHITTNNKERLNDYFPITLEKTETVDRTKDAIKLYNMLAVRNELHVLLVEHIDTKDIVGVLFLKNIDMQVSKCELAYFIDKDHEKKGYATQAIKLALNTAFNELNLNKVYCRIDPANLSSNKVVVKNNFQLEGVLKQEFRISNGTLVDLNYYGLLKTDFQH